jgi:hypothetical protein
MSPRFVVGHEALGIACTLVSQSFLEFLGAFDLSRLAASFKAINVCLHPLEIFQTRGSNQFYWAKSSWLLGAGFW